MDRITAGYRRCSTALGIPGTIGRSLIHLVLAPSLAISLAMPRPLSAEQVYRWSDPAGQIHFSDTPPADGAVVEEVRPAAKPDTPASPANEVDYSIEAQARRMEAERLEREARRQASELQQQEERIRALEQRARDAEDESARLRSEQQDIEVYPSPVYPYPHRRHPLPGWDDGYRPYPFPPAHPPRPRPPPPKPKPSGGRLIPMPAPR